MDTKPPVPLETRKLAPKPETAPPRPLPDSGRGLAETSPQGPLSESGRGLGEGSATPEAADSQAPTSPVDAADIQQRIIDALKTCYDPEIPVNIYEMGLIYDIQIESPGAVAIKMTLTSPGCPVAGTLPREVQSKVQGVPGVTSAKVDVVWDPPWDPSKMSEAARLTLGFF